MLLVGCNSILGVGSRCQCRLFFPVRNRKSAWHKAWAVGQMGRQFHWSTIEETKLWRWQGGSIRGHGIAGFLSSQILVTPPEFPLKTSDRQTVVYYCIAALLQFSRATMATCTLVKKVTTIFISALFGLLSYRGEVSPGKTQTGNWHFISALYWWICILLGAAYPSTILPMPTFEFPSNCRKTIPFASIRCDLELDKYGICICESDAH